MAKDERGHKVMVRLPTLLGGPQGDDRTPPLPISSDFFSTFIDVSGSGPRSQPGNERYA